MHEDIKQIYIYHLNTIHIYYNYNYEREIITQHIRCNLLINQKELYLRFLFALKIFFNSRDLLPEVKQFIISILLGTYVNKFYR